MFKLFDINIQGEKDINQFKSMFNLVCQSNSSTNVGSFTYEVPFGQTWIIVGLSCINQNRPAEARFRISPVPDVAAGNIFISGNKKAHGTNRDVSLLDGEHTPIVLGNQARLDVSDVAFQASDSHNWHIMYYKVIL